MSFKMNPEFNKQLAREVAAKVQADILDPIQRRYRGRPVSEVKLALQQEFERVGGAMPDAELEKYANAISQGIPVRAQGVVR